MWYLQQIYDFFPKYGKKPIIETKMEHKNPFFVYSKIKQ
jgi:hypothetical protein